MSLILLVIVDATYMVERPADDEDGDPGFTGPELAGGAPGAAKISQDLSGLSAQLAILISCVGRRLVLKQRVEEEVEGVRDVLGKNAVLAGFYSYGEISPHTPSAKCELHNQTMTITTFNEI